MSTNRLVLPDVEKLTSLLAEQSMTPGELVIKSGVSSSTILRALKGKRMYRSSLREIAAGLGVQDYRFLLKQPTLPPVQEPPSRDISCVVGDWEGRETQFEGELKMPVEYSAELHLKLRDDGRVEGDYAVKNEITQEEFPFTVISSRSFNGQFLWLRYKGGDPAVVRFGVYLLQLSGDARVLEGGAVGHSTLALKPTIATVKLTKLPRDSSHP